MKSPEQAAGEAAIATFTKARIDGTHYYITAAALFDAGVKFAAKAAEKEQQTQWAIQQFTGWHQHCSNPDIANLVDAMV